MNVEYILRSLDAFPQRPAVVILMMKRWLRGADGSVAVGLHNRL